MSIGEYQDRLKRLKLVLPRAPDDRDAVIQRLERSVAAEQERSAELQKTIDELRFQLQILERSYSKQLEDARVGREDAEQALAALEVAHGESTQLLADVRGELERVIADRNRLRRRLAGPESPETASQDGADSLVPEDTINRLMSASSWNSERPAARHTEAHAEPGADGQSEEMLSAEAVFPAGSEDEE
jgi:chromosome segregation ATPase